MKCVLILSMLAVLLGGCAIVPAGYGDNRGDNRNGYDQGREYGRGDGYYRDRDYNRYYGNERYSYDHDRNGDPFQQHGH